MRTEELGPSLLAAFARVPDVRSRHGRRYPLPALLTLSTAAMLSGARSLYAIVQWGQLQPSEVQRALGFTRGRMPAISTLRYAFKRLDVPAFEAVLQEWAAPALGTADRHLVLDGKALRGIHGDELPGVRLVALYAPEAGLVLIAGRGVRTNEERAATAEDKVRAKQEAELSVAPRLLRRVHLAGWLVSGDALYCQRALCRQVHRAGGDYPFAIKEDQPTLLDDVTLLFRDPPPGERFLQARTVTKHSGRLEERRLRASASLATYLREAGWAAVGLVLEVETVVRWPAQPARPARRELRYFLSSWPPITRPADALQAVRRHWQIENRLHWPRDVILGEDACRVRTGNAPQVLAAVRNVVVGLLHRLQVSNLAAAVRAYAWSPVTAVLALLGIAPP